MTQDLSLPDADRRQRLYAFALLRACPCGTPLESCALAALRHGPLEAQETRLMALPGAAVEACLHAHRACECRRLTPPAP